MRVVTGARALVYLDNEPVEDVVMADEELGRVTVLERNRFGEIVFVNGRVLKRTDAGRVTIVRLESHA